MNEEITNIFDSEGVSFIGSVGIIDVSVHYASEYSKHPLEDGTAITDNQINRQTQINVTCMTTTSDYADVLRQIDDARTSAKKFTVQTKICTHADMYITDLTYVENAKSISAVSFNVSFVQQQTVKAKHTKLRKSNVRKSKNASSTKSGTKTGQTTDDGSLAYKALSKLKGFF